MPRTSTGWSCETGALEEAQEARAIRLTELCHAAAQVAIIGEYYKLRARSTRATYGGILCTLIGIAAILIAFTWPMTSAGH